tara:strand:+ start:1168 stop:1683 length:516 start_codon:yes stop_codon:yes gene_type:complete
MDNKKKIKFDFEKKYQQVSGIKPNGFWYSCYNDWYNFTQREDQFVLKYIHQININSKVSTNIQNKNKDKLLVIHNLKDFDIFNSRYAYKGCHANEYKNDQIILQDYLVDWDKVSQDYGGIQICPYLKKRKHISWYASFDVASGCVWNIKSIIKNSDLIYEKKKGKYVKVSA